MCILKLFRKDKKHYPSKKLKEIIYNFDKNYCCNDVRNYAKSFDERIKAIERGIVTQTYIKSVDNSQANRLNFRVVENGDESIKNFVVNFEGLIPQIADTFYPVGSYYISEGELPHAIRLLGEWVELADGTFLESSQNAVGINKDAKLPNIKGTAQSLMSDQGSSETIASGAFEFDTAPRERHYDGATGNGLKVVKFNASNYNNIYDDNTTTVQPKSRTVHIWRRTR